jgi:uncharacterized protein (TIGR01777 family)
MEVFITGGTGFVGRHLSRFMLDKGHRVTVTGLRPTQDIIHHDRFEYISADTTQPGPWQEELAHADVIINLAGKTIFKRWSKSYKQEMYDSRILTTRNLVAALPQKKGIVFCSTSAVGYYGEGGDETLSEDAANGEDFLAHVSIGWEEAAMAAADKGARVVILRFGIVLGNDGGALAKMLPAFKSFAGGPLGSGKQWFPWIHMDDLLSALAFVMENKEIEGPVNFCAPHPVRNRDLAKALGKILKRPSVMPAPALMIRMVMGEMAMALLASQRAVPDKLLSHGFNFQYPEIKDALKNLIGK